MFSVKTWSSKRPVVVLRVDGEEHRVSCGYRHHQSPANLNLAGKIGEHGMTVGYLWRILVKAFMKRGVPCGSTTGTSRVQLDWCCWTVTETPSHLVM